MTQRSLRLSVSNLCVTMLVSLGFTSLALADNLPTPTVIKDGNQMIISWSAYSGSDAFEGYALQWGKQPQELKITNYARQYLGKTTSLSIRGTDFLRSTDYYFRVYTWYTSGNNGQKVLANGSPIRKWRENTDWTFTNEEVAANDPVIVNNNNDSGSTSSSDEEFDFPYLSAKTFDTFVQMSWAQPNLASQEYDGTKIEIATDSSFSNIVGELRAGQDKIKGELTGLSPETNYYLRGSYHKNGETLGAFATKTIETIKLVPRDGSTVASRNMLRILKKKIHPSADIGQFTADSGGATTSSGSSSSSSSPSSFNSSNANTTQIRARIRELEALVSKYQAEIRSLQNKIGVSSSSGSRSSSTLSSLRSRLSSRSSSGSSRTSRLSSIRARLAERLQSRRNGSN